MSTDAGGLPTQPGLVAGTNIAIAGDWPNQTINNVAGGLVNWTEGVNIVAPNNGIPVVFFKANNAAFDVDVVFNAKGNGSILAQVPDNTTTGGNKRGINAVDFQTQRSAAANVAGAGYTGLFGYDNKITVGGTYGFCSGFGNIVSNTAAASFGSANTASGTNAFTTGTNSLASGVSAQAGGSNCSATQSNTYAHGDTCTADGAFSQVRGNNGIARGTKRVDVWSSGRNSNAGDAQRREACLIAATTNATVTTLTTDGLAASATNQFALFDAGFNQLTFAITGIVVAKVGGTSNCAMWEIKALAYWDTSVVNIVGTPTVTQLFATAGTAATWVITVAVDATNVALAIKATGAAATPIRWNANVRSIEVY